MEILIVIVAVLCGILIYRLFGIKKNNRQDTDRQLIREVRSVVSDFLEAGELVRMLSREAYQGTLSVRAHADTMGRTGYLICMYDSGDIQRNFREFKQEFPLEDFPELSSFVSCYAECYDPQRDALIYTTECRMKLSEGEREKLEQRLQQSLSEHPLAEVESLGLIRTKRM